MGEKIVGGIIFILAGLFFIGIGIYVAFFHTGGYEKTTAEITGFEYVNHPGKQNKLKAVPVVKYTVDGVTYEGATDNTSSTYTLGKIITIYYNPENPSQIKGNSKTLGLFVSAIGLMAVLVAPIIIIKGPDKRAF